jgi:hypothetical protein
LRPGCVVQLLAVLHKAADVLKAVDVGHAQTQQLVA